MAQTWLVLKSDSSPAAWNMAVDEALLEYASHGAAPLLRFYGWTEPAATFGYSQHYAEVASWTQLRPLVRRPTGGGLVPHDADWTYSLIVPPQHAWYRQKAVDTYCRVHQWIQQSFQSLGVRTTLAASPHKPAPGQCFIGAEQFDLLLAGAKIAGAAQRRNRQGLLVQGSVQAAASGCERAAWENAMRVGGPPGEEVRWEEFALSPELVARATALAGEKYSQATHNERR